MHLFPMLAAATASLALLASPILASPARADDGPDLIFKKSTVFKWLSPNDKLATYGLDDPEKSPTFRLPAGNTGRSSSRTNSSRAMSYFANAAR